MLWSFGALFGRNSAGRKRERLAAQRLEAIRRRFAHLTAKYDTATTTAENKRQWALADGLSARSANSLMVRKILRGRSRYEWLPKISTATQTASGGSWSTARFHGAASIRTPQLVRKTAGCGAVPADPQD